MTRLEQYLQDLQRFGIKPGLDRIRALLQRLGDPQTKYPILLVGGTNGKGSTCEFLARMIAEDGKQDGRRVGLYTSPHLYNWNERIRILGSGELGQAAGLFPGAISDAELDALFEQALPHIEAIAADETFGQPTEFEVLTALGFLHFANQRVDAAVIEVGLGGKWDATNVCDPMVSVITHVAIDHCDRLGNTVEEIARDKVEIARAGRVLVTAETKPEVLRVFEEHCKVLSCKLRIVDYRPDPTFQEINFQTARLARGVLYDGPNWQDQRNLPEWLTRVLPKQRLSIVDYQWQVPARFEIIRENPTVILDGANNPDGARTLVEELKQRFAHQPNAKLILVLGILLDKDWQQMAQILAPLAEVVIATQSTSPRAAAAELIARAAKEHCAHVETSTPVPAAVARALELAGEKDVICITGSFYTVAEVRRAEINPG